MASGNAIQVEGPHKRIGDVRALGGLDLIGAEGEVMGLLDPNGAGKTTLELERAYDELRPLAFSIAYRLLGSFAEAEDVAQEAFIRYQGALTDNAGQIESPKAYLSTIAKRLALDQLRSARNRYETCVGDWLPESVATADIELEGARYVENSESLSIAFRRVLEQLSPVERAALLLHDVFDYAHSEIARIIGKSEANCRQLAARARRRVREEPVRFDAAKAPRERLAERFFDVVAGDGPIEDLVEMLAADAVV